MPAGVTFGSDQFVFSTDERDCLEVNAIEFETWILDKDANEMRHSDPEDATNPKALYRLTATLLSQQARFGAAGRSQTRRTGSSRYRTTLDKYQVVKEGWTIVAKADLTVQALPGVEAGKPASYEEAVQGLRQLRQEQPSQRGLLKILRPSELVEP